MQAENLPLRRAQVFVQKTPEEFPLGARGTRPVKFSFKDQATYDQVKRLEIPGVLYKSAALAAVCSFDAAITIADELGDGDLFGPCLSRRLSSKVPTPGMDRYKALPMSSKRRQAQAEGISWLAKRAYAILADPPRGGKTLQLLGATVVTGAQRTLIVCPAIAKRVWQEEVKLWCKEKACLLFGRSGTEVWEVCDACFDKTNEERYECQACGGTGDVKHVRHELEVVQERIEWQEPWITKTGKTSYRNRVAWASKLPRTYACPKHTEVTASRPVPCRKCRDEIVEIIARHKYVVTNYDILTTHVEEGLRGVELVREDLPGWAPALGRLRFDAAICDEIHRVRMQKSKTASGSKNRREVLKDVLKGIPRVYGATGTLTCGFVRDYWGPLDIISDGLWS